MPRPDLFILGAPKAGTTSLHTYLAQHPQVFMSAVKEPHHFGSDLKLGRNWCVPKREDYEALFEGAGDARRIGESSVYSMISEVAAAEVKAYSPDARVILMLRNPVDAVWALHWQFLKSANEDIEDLDEALDAEADRREGRRIPASVHNRLALQYTRTYDYEPHIRRLYDAFGPEFVHIDLFDRLRSDPQGLYRDVLRFLEVDETFTPDFDVVNPAVPVRNLPLRRAIARVPSLHRAIGKLPTGWRHAVGNAAAVVTRDKRDRSSLRPETARRLVLYYEPRLASLERLLGRNLDVWRDAWHKHTGALPPR